MNPEDEPQGDGPDEIEGPEYAPPSVPLDPETGELPNGWEWTDE